MVDFGNSKFNLNPWRSLSFHVYCWPLYSPLSHKAIFIWSHRIYWKAYYVIRTKVQCRAILCRARTFTTEADGKMITIKTNGDVTNVDGWSVKQTTIDICFLTFYDNIKRMATEDLPSAIWATWMYWRCDMRWQSGHRPWECGKSRILNKQRGDSIGVARFIRLPAWKRRHDWRFRCGQKSGWQRSHRQSGKGS